MGVSIPEMLTLESKPEGSEEASHTYKGHMPGEFVHNSRSKGAGWLELRWGRERKEE